MRVPVTLLLGPVLLAAVLLAGGMAVGEDGPPAKAKAVCPVGGKAINMEVSADYNGGKVYFCCGGCIKPFQKDTAKFAAKANHQLVCTGQAAQTGCPISGKAVKPDAATEVAGVSVGFCCGGCSGKVAKADPQGQLELVFGEKAFAKGFKVKAE
ncbi:MAG: hypothetical protein HQ581_07775 [Planctomycetes bacterium]|nr:hypothetical protein [Planctomycetota bacterium]